MDNGKHSKILERFFYRKILCRNFSLHGISTQVAKRKPKEFALLKSKKIVRKSRTIFMRAVSLPHFARTFTCAFCYQILCRSLTRVVKARTIPKSVHGISCKLFAQFSLQYFAQKNPRNFSFHCALSQHYFRERFYCAELFSKPSYAGFSGAGLSFEPSSAESLCARICSTHSLVSSACSSIYFLKPLR